MESGDACIETESNASKLEESVQSSQCSTVTPFFTMMSEAKVLAVRPALFRLRSGSAAVAWPVAVASAAISGGAARSTWLVTAEVSSGKLEGQVVVA